MKPNTIYNEDCISGLRKIASNSIDCCVTSPPYFGLRDYGHRGQLGLEESPEKYTSNIVRVFNQVFRVLKPTGTLWLNLGDSYSGSWGNYGGKNRGAGSQRIIRKGSGVNNRAYEGKEDWRPPTSGKMGVGIKRKDLIGIPWMVAFALRKKGWYLRQDIIWHKPNPMPESVVDRCTKAHEYIFLMSKSKRYYFDKQSISTPSSRAGEKSYHDFNNPKYDAILHDRWKHQFDGRKWGSENIANKRSVWTVSTKPFMDAHFATFPEDLISDCILAGCPEGGIVLDPFMGAGTTAVVSKKLNRNYIGFEINAEYIKIIEKRMQVEFGLFNQTTPTSNETKDH